MSFTHCRRRAVGLIMESLELEEREEVVEEEVEDVVEEEEDEEEEDAVVVVREADGVERRELEFGEFA